MKLETFFQRISNGGSWTWARNSGPMKDTITLEIPTNFLQKNIDLLARELHMEVEEEARKAKIV